MLHVFKPSISLSFSVNKLTGSDPNSYIYSDISLKHPHKDAYTDTDTDTYTWPSRQQLDRLLMTSPSDTPLYEIVLSARDQEVDQTAAPDSQDGSEFSAPASTHRQYHQ